MVADTVVDCLEECADHATCVAVEVNETATDMTSYDSPAVVECRLHFFISRYINIPYLSSVGWLFAEGLSTFVIEHCPESGRLRSLVIEEVN